MEEPSFSGLAQVWAILIFSAISLAVFTFVLETEPVFQSQAVQEYVATTKSLIVLLNNPSLFCSLFYLLEAFCIIIFVTDYVTRFVCCPSKRDFILSVYNTIDLLTIVPFFLDEINEVFSPRGGAGAVLRVLRVFRVFRIFKITK
jgi:hypothetical protein